LGTVFSVILGGRNVFDLVLVVLQIIEELLTAISSTTGTQSNFVLRLARVLRTTRVFRVLRVARLTVELRLIVAVYYMCFVRSYGRSSSCC